MTTRELPIAVFVGILVLIFLSTPALAGVPPHTAAVPGGLVVVPLGSTTRRPPVAHFLNNRVMIQWHDKQWQAVLGIPINIPPGEYPLHVQASPEAIPQNFPIVITPKQYEIQPHPVARDGANLSSAERARVQREKREIILALRHWEERGRVPTAFQPPVQGVITHPFGIASDRNRNTQPLEAAHIEAASGTPVLAPAGGIVIGTGDYFYDGKTVFLDHGQGLVTLYAHLQDITVTPGQSIKQGDTIGSVGMSGKVAYPQLQWGVNLNGAAVDPLLFLTDPSVLTAPPTQTAAQASSPESQPEPSL